MSWLDDIRKRLEAATPGRWVERGPSSLSRDLWWVVEADGDHRTIAECSGRTAGGPGDRALIASAPTDLVRLLRVAETAQAVDDEMVAIHDGSGAGRRWGRVATKILALRAALAEEPEER